MASFTIDPKNWEKVKIKFLRKYRELSLDDIQFKAGEEEQLITKLMHLVNRDRSYIEFTIKKALADVGNRL